MFGLAQTLNAAHGHRRHHRHHNRASSVSGGTPERLSYFGGKKVGEALFGIALGASQAYGDPLFFSDDPAKAVGPKLLGAAVLNVAEFVMLWKGYSFSGMLGPKLGAGADGVVSGGASACWSIWTFDQSNLYFAAKISSSTSPPGTAGPDYGASRRELHAPAPESRQLRPADAAQAARREEFAGRSEAAQAMAGRARGNMRAMFNFT